ncbi:hypothetical protein [Streptomyces sp. CAU 1734]|uniref:hypothetical protein n=1 Tax=Streptomyces sp. CAU 1734 TaxID=3140360 RepID=UPI00326035CF
MIRPKAYARRPIAVPGSRHGSAPAITEQIRSPSLMSAADLRFERGHNNSSAVPAGSAPDTGRTGRAM